MPSDDGKKRRRPISTVQASFRARRRLWCTFITAAISAIVFSILLVIGLGKGATSLRLDRERDGALRANFPPLQELIDRNRLWPPDLSKPLCKLKIYVYDLPERLRLRPETVTQCRWSAYNSELVLYDLLKSPLLKDLVTDDPLAADVFFVPLFPACYLFECWVKAGWNTKLRCDVEEIHLFPVMEWIREQPTWSRNGGSDHIIVHPMDFVDGYYTNEARQAMNSSIYLVTVGDLRPPPYSVHYRHYRDIVIPSSTHLINSYFVNPRDYLDENGHPLVQTKSAAGRPAPSRAEIFESYANSHMPKRSPRTSQVIFRGGSGRPDEGEEYGLGIRSLFFPTLANATRSHAGFSSLPGWDIDKWSENEDYARALARAKYGLVPPGYTLDTTRLWEYLAFGVVPIFIGTGPRGGQVMPFASDFDYASFSISVPRDRAHLLPSIVASISEEEYERKRRAVWNVGRLLVLEQSRGHVWRWIGRELCRIRRIGTGTSEIKQIQ